jgi:hypothetical protein
MAAKRVVAHQRRRRGGCMISMPLAITSRDGNTTSANTNDAYGTGIATNTNTTRTTTRAAAMVYILSGICQPLLMTACKNSGLADSQAQLYMLFYYAGPSSLLLTLLPCCQSTRASPSTSNQATTATVNTRGPSVIAVAKASGIACFDIAAQSLNYAGAGLAGATIFAVVYSSVTVWTAIFSRVFCGRHLNLPQCYAIALVVAGLCITALDSVNLGRDVARGTALVILGSCMHGGTYVMSEAIMVKPRFTNDKANDIVSHTAADTMTSSDCRSLISPSSVPPPPTPPPFDHWRRCRDDNDHLLSVRENSAIQGSVACGGLLAWQLVYTLPRWDTLIGNPMRAAGTSTLQAILLLVTFGMANLLHSVSFFHTLAHYPGGSTSAGVMKGLQAVLVFVVAHVLYCSQRQTDACLSTIKFLSLISVVSGVVLYSAHATSDDGKASRVRGGYAPVGNAVDSVATGSSATPLQGSAC